MSNQQREFDVIVWGASGFTGRLVADYLYRHFGSGSKLRWAMAGRDRGKLESVRTEIGADDVPIVLADSHDTASLLALAARTKVICTTVGPYSAHGTELVGACVKQGTDYCDLTGEVPWIRQMIDTYEADAARSGARIVHCCGFDSIPSDLGVLFLQNAARDAHDETLEEIKYLVEAMRGAASGGTVASLLLVIEAARADRSIARLLKRPYSLNPPDQQSGPDGSDQMGARYDEDIDAWTGPFVMAAINTKIVRRTNALLDYPYGRNFRYSESVVTGKGLVGRAKALAMSAAIGGLMIGAALKPTRALLKTFVLPAAGDGPNKHKRENGFFNISLVGKFADGRTLRGKVTADRDPGYGATCGMLAESAVCLAQDVKPGAPAGGFWTPASALGMPLIERLRARAGMTFELVD